MTKRIGISLFVLFIFQMIVASTFELAHDEAYYWLYSRHLDWGYFDHPPFVGAVIRIFSFLPHSEIAVRIGFIILQFASLLILFAMGAPPLLTSVLFFSFPLASFTGLLALPDIPLLFMTACYCWQLKKFLETDTVKNSTMLGLIIALLFYAKYHGVLLIFFTLIAVPKLFQKKTFYLVALVAFLCFLPHMVWQYEHDFSTLRYHFFERPSSSFSFKRSLEFIALQVLLAGVFAGPLVWREVVRKKSIDPYERSLKFMALGTVIFFLFSSFSKRVEANWTIFLTIPLVYLSSQGEIWKKKWARILLWTSFIIVITARLLFLLPPELGPKRLKEFHGWAEWAKNIEKECAGIPVMANSYQIASKLSFYLEKEVQALNYHSRKNQFDYWRFDKGLPSKVVCYVTDKVEFSGLDLTTPEGKKLMVIKNQSIEALWELKYKEIR